MIDALTGPKRSAPALRAALEHGERIILPSLALYEWLRGPRSLEELEAQETLFPSHAAISFGPLEAGRAADLYSRVGRSRGREIDLAIAACALVHDAMLWTLDAGDFADVPELRLFAPA